METKTDTKLYKWGKKNSQDDGDVTCDDTGSGKSFKETEEYAASKGGRLPTTAELAFKLGGVAYPNLSKRPDTNDEYKYAYEVAARNDNTDSGRNYVQIGIHPIK